MNMRKLVLMGNAALIGMVMGCSQEPEVIDPGYTQNEPVRERYEQPASTPDRSSAPTGRLAEGAPRGTSPADGRNLGFTEFAALDTDSNGILRESEWRPGAVRGLEFEHVDKDGSGTVDAEEFEAVSTGQSKPFRSLSDEAIRSPDRD